MTTQRRRWFRFGLKSLLVLMTVLCLWFGYHANQVSSRRQALAHIAKLGGVSWHQGQFTAPDASTVETYWSKLSRHYENLVCLTFGDELRRDVSAVDLSQASISKSDLAKIQPLSEIEWLTITGETVDDNSAEELRSFRRLRWLDISGTRMSMDGVKRLDVLRSLEWLNIASTRVAESDIATIQDMFPNTEIGSILYRLGIASPSNQVVSPDFNKNVDHLWTDLLKYPYSNKALEEYLKAIERSYAVDFPKWYISGVFLASRPKMEPLLVIQVYNGTQGVSFNLGCLLIFDPEGDLLREIPKERVHFSLRGPTKQADWYDTQIARGRAEQLAVKKQETIDLPDLTGDGFADIPTQRWDQTINTTFVGGEATSIYTSNTEAIPCVFCLVSPRRPPGGLLRDTGIVLSNLAYRDLESGKLSLQAPCYAPTSNGNTLMADLPQRTLATFYWSESANTFVGPSQGPHDTWKVFDRE